MGIERDDMPVGGGGAIDGWIGCGESTKERRISDSLSFVLVVGCGCGCTAG